MWLLQRAVLVEEWQDGLLLFAGVPPKWLQAGASIAFRNFPTAYGRVSASLKVAQDGTSAQVRVESTSVNTLLRVSLPGQSIETVSSTPFIELHFALS